MVLTSYIVFRRCCSRRMVPRSDVTYIMPDIRSMVMPTVMSAARILPKSSVSKSTSARLNSSSATDSITTNISGAIIVQG